MMDWYLEDVRALEARLQAVGNPLHCPIFYGSSTVRLWTRLAEDLATPQILNAGFGGSTLAACVWFFDRIVLPRVPSSLVVYAGDNDLGDGQSPEQVCEAFRQLQRKVLALGPIPFTFISVKPSPARAHILDRISRANQMIEAEMARQNSGYFLDLYGQMLDGNGKPRQELFQDDGLHLNENGYKLWAAILGQDRERIFTQFSTIPVSVSLS